MKLQNFAVIFIIIMLPISMILSMYTGNLIDVANREALYNSILLNSTYDAVKAYQMNTIGNSYESENNSKVRDVNASINSFFNSLASGFTSTGLSKDELTDYIPAMLYTLYDGYYVYGTYDNIVDTEGQVSYNTEGKVRNKQYGLKPYIYYSCEYADQAETYDLVVNYTLDNYITVTGMYTANGSKQYISKSGYYINYNNIKINQGATDPAGFDDKKVTLNVNDGIEGNEIDIVPEKLGEYLITIDMYRMNSTDSKYAYKLSQSGGKARYYNYILYNGVKYYLDDEIINVVIEHLYKCKKKMASI